MRNLLLFFIFAFTVTTPALADKFFAVTPNGAVEADFADKSETVVGKISSRCIDSGWTIVSSSQSSVTCEAPLSGTQSFVGQLLMGNAYSTPPKRYFQFNSTQVLGKDTRESRRRAGWSCKWHLVKSSGPTSLARNSRTECWPLWWARVGNCPSVRLFPIMP